MRKVIRGAGGGGGGGSSGGRESSDTLLSKAYVKLIDVIAEGEIEGLVDGAKSIYFDDTPVESSNGARNFANVTFDERVGTQGQAFVPGFASAQTERSVGVEVIKSVPITRTITNLEVSAVRVRISTPSLVQQDASGNLVGTTVEFRIRLQNNGGGFTTYLTTSFSGKASAKYERSFLVNLPSGGPWDIQVERITDDSTSASLSNKIIFESFTEIVEAKLRYPNTAYVALRVSAEQFSGIPTRGYDIKGLRIEVPSNYDPETRAYTGVWDGTFVVAYSNNPAWVFRDIIVNDRYGLGDYISPDQVDKWALYEIAQYCDELVDDGFGGLEPRFTINVALTTREEAYKVLSDLAACFRAITFWTAGTIQVVQDAPSDPVQLFSPANVVDGLFTYQGSGAKTRHNVALVTWNDPSDLYRQTIEYVEDAASVIANGVIQTDVVAFGCTSRGQANRVGRWLLYSEQYEQETVTFKTSIEAALCKPGQIIKVADPARAGSRRGGRITSATSSSIVTDAALTGTTAGLTLMVMLPSGVVESRSVVSVSGRTITISGTFSEVPNSQSMWLVTSSTVEAQSFKVISVTESEQDGQLEITALAHDPNKFAAIEQGVKLEDRSISELTLTPAAPQNLTLSEALYQSSAEVRVKLVAAWTNVPGAIGYFVRYRYGEGNFIDIPQQSSTDFELLDAQPGTYEVRVSAVSGLGIRGEESSATYTVVGKVAPPADVQNFSLVPLAGRAELTWSQASDLDVIVGGEVRIRWSPVTSGAEWKNAVDIIPAVPGNATRITAPLLAGTYLAKFVDSSGVSSETEASIVTTIPEALALNVVETLTESPAFAGNKTDVEINPEDGYLNLTSAGLLDDVTSLIDSLPEIDSFGSLAAEGTYEFSDTVDLGAVYTSRVTVNIEVETVSVFDFIDTRPGTIDTWADLDGSKIEDCFADLYMRTTEDDPSGSPTWTQWKPFFVSEYKARGYQFKLVLRTDDTTHNIKVKTLSVTIDMPDRIEQARSVASGTSPLTITFATPFYETPSLGITARDMASGDFYTITSEDEEGFTIVFKDSSNANINRSFDWLAKGYGRKVA